MSVKIVIGLSLLSLFYLSDAQYHGFPCGPHAHCDWKSGLICVGENNHGRCTCPNGTLTDTLSYKLVWDAAKTLCVGQRGSACTGTRRAPVTDDLKAMECEESLSCIQIPGMPPGVGTCQNIPKAQLHGVECNADKYCDSSRGLICDNGNCACASERPGTSPKYSLVWVDEENNCLATVGSACVGTRLYPSTHGEKTIECVLEADCVDAEQETPGIGICRSRLQDTTTPTQSTGSPSSSTTEGRAGTISISHSIILFTMTIAFTAGVMC